MAVAEGHLHAPARRGSPALRLRHLAVLPWQRQGLLPFPHPHHCTELWRVPRLLSAANAGLHGILRQRFLSVVTVPFCFSCFKRSFFCQSTKIKNVFNLLIRWYLLQLVSLAPDLGSRICPAGEVEVSDQPGDHRAQRPPPVLLHPAAVESDTGLPGGLGQTHRPQHEGRDQAEIRQESTLKPFSLVEMDGVHFRLGKKVIPARLC